MHHNASWKLARDLKAILNYPKHSDLTRHKLDQNKDLTLFDIAFELFTASAEKVFTREDGTQFDYVFNLAAETKYGQSEEVKSLRKYINTLSSQVFGKGLR